MFYVVPGYEFAEVNELGQIRSSLTKSIYRPYTDKDGYLRCKVWDGFKLLGVYVHRAIALVFVDNPDSKPIVNHIDSNRANNSIANLEWVTPKENSEHGVKAGNFLVNEDAFASVYSNEQIKQVCELLSEGLTAKKISKETGVSLSVVNSVKIRRTWREISEQYTFHKTKPKITDDVALEIKRLVGEGKSVAEIVQTINHPRVNSDTVRNIKKGKTFKHLKVTFNDQSSDVASSEAKR